MLGSSGLSGDIDDTKASESVPAKPEENLYCVNFYVIPNKYLDCSIWILQFAGIKLFTPSLTNSSAGLQAKF